MILGDRATAPASAAQGGMTIDDLFRRVARRRPDALALLDAPNRQSFTDGAARRLTYAEADRVVTGLARRLRRMGLPGDAIVGVQLPNVVENILTILGVLRAGMIAAPLPLLWRRADAVTALQRLGAKALITCGRVGGFDHCDFAMHVAAEVFSIRYVCGFGESLPDGVVSLDELFTSEEPEPTHERDALFSPAAHLAVITWDLGPDGLFPVARSHFELFAGGLATTLEGGLPQDGSILSGYAPSSFAGLCLGMLPWLLSGATLALHHPFDAAGFARQRRDLQIATALLPAPVAFRLAATGALAADGLERVIAVWHAPERMPESPIWPERDVALVDVPVFGEIGLLAVRRDACGRPAAIPVGAVAVPRESENATIVAELVRSETGTIALRGPMVPRFPFAPGAERPGFAHLEVGLGALVDTGYTCLPPCLTDARVVAAPPAGIVSVGGYRFRLHELRDVIARIESTATLAALPDGVLGHRLIGSAPDRHVVQEGLKKLGLNPLVVAAFGDRADRAAGAIEVALTTC